MRGDTVGRDPERRRSADEHGYPDLDPTPPPDRDPETRPEPPDPPPTRAVAPRRRPRDPRWDTVRFVAAALVVFVHLTPQLTDHDAVRWLHVAAWPLRVPTFALLAGYFSHAGPLIPRGARPLTRSLVLPFLAVGLLHTLERRWTTGAWRFFLVEPAWAMWFLLSLLCWRLALPWLARLHHPLTLSVVVAVVVGYVPAIDGTLAVSRTLAFLPFFLLGWRLREGLFAGPLRASWSRPVALAVLAATAVGGWLLRDDIRLGWLTMRGPYRDHGPAEAPWAWTVRGALLLVGMVVALAFLRVMPRRRVPFLTYLGSGGMFVYLLHPLALRLLARADIGVGRADTWPEQAALPALAVALTAALASPPVRRLTRPLVRPGRRPA